MNDIHVEKKLGKKRKKEKREEVEEPLVVKESNGVIGEKKKKKKKDKKREEDAPVTKKMKVEENGNEMRTCTDEKKKKKKKKDKKSEEGVTEDVPPVNKKMKVKDFNGNSNGNGLVSEDKKTKKKDKKKKTSIVVDSSGELKTINGYVQHADLASMTPTEVDTFRTKHSIGVYPPAASEFYKPMPSFDHLLPTLGERCPRVTSYVKRMEFVTPSPIQAQCWPPLLAGKDVVGVCSSLN